MLIDNNIIPSYIYFFNDVGELNNSNMSDKNNGTVNDTTDDANNVNDTNIINNDNIEPSEARNENNEPNEALVVVDSNEVVECNSDDDEGIVVTDGSIVTAPSNYSKKKKKAMIPNR